MDENKEQTRKKVKRKQKEHGAADRLSFRVKACMLLEVALFFALMIGWGAYFRSLYTPSAPPSTTATTEATAATTEATAPAPTQAPPVAMELEFAMTDESLAEMRAKPAATLSALEAGLADGLAVEPSAVKITSTDPDLSPPRRLSLARRLDSTLTVNFEIVGNAEVAIRMSYLAAGDDAVAQEVVASVLQNLDSAGINATIVSVAASLV